MVFASTQFLFAFLPLFFICYYGIGKVAGLKWKNLVLLIFSMIFYAWGEPVYVLLMVYSTCLDYTCGQMIHKGRQENKPWLSKLFLGVSLAGNLIPLALFKYTDMFLMTANNLMNVSIPVLGLTLPIGISFYTFQTMSYSIDVYRGKVEVQNNILYFGAYVVMFPQLIAGPVVRYSYVAEKLNDREETFEDFVIGLRRFIVGLSKKIIIANSMAAVCDSLFKLEATKLGALGSWVAIIAYTFQIYYDFSGYSDMAMGMGRMMGFNYPENFNFPYISKSITEFWRRWHITMSTFFRDYVYIPLGGSRVSAPRWVLNVLVVWALTGLWHGASWNFVLWGLYFALILMIEKLFMKKLLDKSHVLSRVWTLFLVIFGWVLFNATDDRGGLTWLAEYTKALFGGYGFMGTADIPVITEFVRANVSTVFFITLAAAAVFSAPVVPYLKDKIESAPDSTGKSVILYLADAALVVGLLICIGELAVGSYNPFIYFRF